MSKLLYSRDFTKEEIIEINGYITANLPYSYTSQMAPVTEKLMDKCKIYINIFRFISSAKNYVSEATTKDKLNKILEVNEPVYNEIYATILNIETSTTNWGSHHNTYKLKRIVNENNILINDFVDLYLVFIEKQVLIDIDKVAGYNLETEEGRQAYQKLLADQ